MTIEDGHFRSDGKTIEPCCERMKNTLCLLNVRCCPFCGAKLEYVKKLKASQ